MTGGRGLRLLGAVLLAVGVLLPAAATPVAAAGATFGQQDAEVTYTEGITFTVPITVTGPLERVEIRLRYPDSLGPFVEEVPAPGLGSHTLTYRLDTSGAGYLVPNTTIEVSWAALAEGEDAPVVSATDTVRYSDTNQEWRTMEGAIVNLHWFVGDEAFGKAAQRFGDQSVKETLTLLGLPGIEPVDFFVYGDAAAFRTALGPGIRENTGGRAHAEIRTMFALITPELVNDPWTRTVISHELVHYVFDAVVENPYRFPPLWINEGLAVYLSEGYTPSDRALVEDAVADRRLIPLTALSSAFRSNGGTRSLAYAEAASAISHLVAVSDQDTLLTLITSYRDGLTDDEAFLRALGMDMAQFQASWLGELGAEEPRPYGPVPNPTGPVPPGWDAPVEGQPTAAPSQQPGAATARPGSTPIAGSPGPDGPAAGTGDGTGLLLAAIAGVVLVVVVGMVLARRRAAPR